MHVVSKGKGLKANTYVKGVFLGQFCFFGLLITYSMSDSLMYVVVKMVYFACSDL